MAVWCGLERYDPAKGNWERLDAPGVGIWWRPVEIHPEKLAEKLWEERQIPDGVYRALWAPKDKRFKLPRGMQFEFAAEEGDDPYDPELGEADEPEDDGTEAFAGPELEPEDEYDDQGDLVEYIEEAAGQPAPQEVQQPTPRPPPLERAKEVARRAPLGRSTTPTRRAPLAAPKKMPPPKNLRRPMLPTAFDPPRPEEMTALSQLVYIHSLTERSADRQHEMMLNTMQLMISTVDARAAAAIKAAETRADQTVEFLRSATDSRRRTDLAPLETQLAELGALVNRVADDADANAAEELERQMGEIAKQPEGGQAILSALGSFLQSDAGKLMVDGVRGLFPRSEQQPDPQQLAPPYDPAG